MIRSVILLCVALTTSPVLAQPPKTLPKRYALLAGVNRYTERGFADKPLEFAERDVEELSSELSKQGFQVKLLKGSSEGKLKATQGNIFGALDSILEEAGANDIVLVGLTGHGNQVVMKDDKGEVLLDSDGKVKEDIVFHPVDAIKNSDLIYPKSVSLAKVLDRLENEGGVNLILLDACRDIPKDPTRGARLVSGNDWKRNMAANTTILFACSGGQRAHETLKAGGGHGVFFHTILEGIRGAAAREKRVTWKSLEAYVIESTNANAEKLIGKASILPDQEELQTPHVIGNLNKNPLLVDLQTVHWLTPQEIARRKSVAKQLFGELKQVNLTQRITMAAKLGDAKEFESALDDLIRVKGIVQLSNKTSFIADPEGVAHNLGLLIRSGYRSNTTTLFTKIAKVRDEVCRKQFEPRSDEDYRREYVEDQKLQLLVDRAGEPEPFSVPSDFAAKIRSIIEKEQSPQREPFNGLYPGIIFLIYADADKCVATVEADDSLLEEIRGYYKTLPTSRQATTEDNSDAPTNRAILASLCGDRAEVLALPTEGLYTHYDYVTLPIIARRDWATLKAFLDKWDTPGQNQHYGASVLNRAVETLLDNGEFVLAIEIWDAHTNLRAATFGTHGFSPAGIGYSTPQGDRYDNFGRLGRDAEAILKIRQIKDQSERERATIQLVNGLLTDVTRTNRR